MNRWLIVGGLVLARLVWLQIRANRLCNQLLAEVGTAEAEAQDWYRAWVLAVSPPVAPERLWSPDDEPHADQWGLDLSRVYVDERHRGDVL